MISQATQFLQDNVIFVVLLVYTVLGLVTDALVRLLERRALAWRRGFSWQGDTLRHAPAPDCADVAAVGAARRWPGPANWSVPSTAAVLDGLDLDIAPGEFVALLGRSGEGKSTLLRALAGLDRRGHGRGDRDGDGRGGVPGPAPVALEAGAGQRGPGPAGQRRRDSGAASALAEVGLAERPSAWPLTLSGGEAQRASLARALVREPDLLLLDEPFGALDALTRMAMHGLVLRLWARHQPAVLLVTHDVDEALALADRVLVLADGRITFSAPVDVPRDRDRDRDHPALIELRHELLRQLGVSQEG